MSTPMAHPARAHLDARLAPRPLGRWDVVSTLRDFALVTYAVPVERLQRWIPAERFAIDVVNLGKGPVGLVSAVPFLDADFRFPNVMPGLAWAFAQTNYRAYVIDRATGEPAVWFFGTTLGHPLVQIPRHLWRLPWHQARYALDCRYDEAAGRYDAFRYDVAGPWGRAAIDLVDEGRPMALLPGFSDLDDQLLRLTHPLAGFFHRRDGALGTYAVWHELMRPTMGTAREAYFAVFEDHGLLTRDEMRSPHSVLIVPAIVFQVHLPPRRLSDARRA